MTPQNTASDVIDFTRQHLLSSIAGPAEFQTVEELWEFRSQLHTLHHYCTQAGLPDALCADVENMLATSKEFWHLIDDNQETLTNLKAYTRVRTLAAEAEGLTNLEELISGEDTLRDVVINGIAFLLNWKSNTIWIDSAKRARKTMTKNYMLELQDRIWQFIKEGYGNRTEAIDLERVAQIRQQVDSLIDLIRAGNPTVEAQVVLLMQVYGMLLRLQLGKLIIRLEELRDS